MIYQFNVIVFESEAYQIRIEVDAEQSFLELHRVLQHALGIPPCQMASFFVSDPSGRKTTEVSQVDMGSGRAPCHYMRRTRICDLVSFDRPFINYTFDFFNDHSLFLELTGINMEKNLREAKVRINGVDTQVDILEIINDNFTGDIESKQVSTDYGVTEDYFEIFGDIEELTL
jgi:hypothetical protein